MVHFKYMEKFEWRVRKYMDQNQMLMKRLNLRVVPTLHVPHQKMPWYLGIALWLLKIARANSDLQFFDTKKQ